MHALLGMVLIAVTVAVIWVLTPGAGKSSTRRSGLDASMAVVGSAAIMIGLAAIISHLAGW